MYVWEAYYSSPVHCLLLVYDVLILEIYWLLTVDLGMKLLRTTI